MTYLIGFTHPTTHYMWEEICLSFRDLHGKREHPDEDSARGLVKRIWENEDIKQIGGKIKEWGARIEPGWDGLVLKLKEDEEEGWAVVDGPGGSAGGWGI